MKIKLFFVILFVVFDIQINRAQNSIKILSKQIGVLYQKGEINPSKMLFQKKIKLLEEQDDLEEYLYAYWDYFMLDPSKNRFYLLKEPFKHLWRRPHNENEHLAVLHLLINQAFHLKKQGAINASIEAYEEALSYYDTQQPNYNILDYCLKPLANNCTRIGDYQRADDYMIRSLQMAKQAKDNKQIVSFSNNLAISKQSQGNFDLAINILQEAIQTPKITQIQKSRIHSELARNWYKKQNYQTALKEAEKAFLYQKNLTDKNFQILINSYTTKGLCFIAKQKPVQAKTEIYKALELALITYETNNREIAKLYILLAEIASLKKEYEEAQVYFQKSLQTLLPEYKPQNTVDNPNPNFFFPENTIKEALDGRASIFILQKDYKNALLNYDLSFEQEELLRNTYSSQKAKIIQQTENRNRSSKVIDLCYNLFKQTKNSDYIVRAFNYAERTKSLVLLDEFRNKERTNQKDSLVLQLNDLKYQKAVLSKEIQLAIHQKRNKEVLNNMISERSELTHKLQRIKVELQKEQSPFQSYKKRDWQNIQKTILKDKKLVVEYFVGATFTTIFKLDSLKGLSWRRIENTSYFNLLEAYFPFFSEKGGSKITNNLVEYNKLALAIYQQILAKELEDTNTKKVLIIPDGMISFIPFDALLTKKTESRNFQKMSFLLKQREIHYGYSIRIMSQPKLQTTRNRKRMGFFPEFSKKQRDLAALPFTQKEKERIQSHFPLSVYEREKATKKAFIANSQEAQIIHLSTHANTKTQNKLSSIEFWEEPLYLTELYGHQINADLVVLSACETGIGEAQKGEGAMSLARGFSYAGVKNLVVSLWKVNDKATSILMGDFYKFLSKNGTATESLHKSKLSYLANKEISNTKKSPYYWASFIPIKNTSEAFTVESNTSSWVIYILVIFLIGLLIYVFKVALSYLKPVFARNEANS